MNLSLIKRNRVITYLIKKLDISQNKLNEARKILQGKLSKGIFDISLICIGLANSYNNCENELEIKEKYYNLSLDIKKSIIEVFI